MYESHWGLRRPPFENRHDPELYYPSSSHEGALLKLRYVVEQRKGAAVLVGDHGVGKTFLTHVLTQALDDESVRVARIVAPRLPADELFAYLAVQLDANPDRDGLHPDLLPRRLRQLSKSGQHPVLILDEAHLLEYEHLERLQLLLNYRDELEIDFSVLLVGLPVLLSHVRRLPGLDSRISVRSTIRAMDAGETADYVRHRLQMSGRDAAAFTDETLQLLGELSGGIPRRLNQVCDLALLVGYSDELTQLTPVEVRAAAEELDTVSVD